VSHGPMCGLASSPADFVLRTLTSRPAVWNSLTNANSVVEAHGRVAILLVWPPTVVQSGYDPTPVSTLLSNASTNQRGDAWR
jgi:hypothetical protein